MGSRAGSPHRSAVRTFHNVEARGSIQFFSPLGRTCHPRGSQPWNLGHAGCLKGSPVRSSVPARRGRGRVSATGGFEDMQRKHEQSTTVARHYQPRSHAPAQRLSLAMCFGPETPNHGCVVAQPKPLHRWPDSVRDIQGDGRGSQVANPLRSLGSLCRGACVRRLGASP